MIVANSCRCSKCGTLLSYEERINIKAFEFIADTQCSGSRNRTIDNFSLCKKCYEKYNEHCSKFFN